MKPTLTYDPDANAVYIRFSDHEIAETVELSDNAYIDLDADGDPVGFEILNADATSLAMVPTLPDTASLRDLMKPPAA